MDTQKTDHAKLKRLFDEVLLNRDAQQKWSENVDPDFIACVEVMIKRYDQKLSKEQWMRTGIMIGAVYEQWRQQNRGEND
jgi:hypothetical protein